MIDHVETKKRRVKYCGQITFSTELLLSLFKLDPEDGYYITYGEYNSHNDTFNICVRNDFIQGPLYETPEGSTYVKITEVDLSTWINKQ